MILKPFNTFQEAKKIHTIYTGLPCKPVPDVPIAQHRYIPNKDEVVKNPVLLTVVFNAIHSVDQSSPNVVQCTDPLDEIKKWFA